jgi:hypothetical protein
MKKQIFNLVVLIVLFSFCMGFAFAATNPNGADINEESEDDGAGATDNPTSHAAVAGNLTEITITGNSTTQSWQGYFGNITGRITLKDSSGNVFYNWTDTDASAGEVYASTNDSIGWAGVNCFNLTGNATETGENLTTLEAAFNIDAGDSDGVDETFERGDHPEFLIGARTVGAGTCNSTKLFGPNKAPHFDEILLYDNSTNSTVFASLINETAGFDSAIHDFEMLVLEDGHSGDVSTTNYYFYIEL